MLIPYRIKDWLYGITHTLPEGDESTIVHAEHPAEELRSVYHAVTWNKDLGGAGITANHGKWKNVTASFPLHDQDACSELLRDWSQKTLLTYKDLDMIRALFGEKVSIISSSESAQANFLRSPFITPLSILILSF